MIYNVAQKQTGLSDGDCTGNGRCVISAGNRNGKNPIQWGRNDNGEQSDPNTRVKYLYSTTDGDVYERWTRNANGTISHQFDVPCKTCASGTDTITAVPPIGEPGITADGSITKIQIPPSDIVPPDYEEEPPPDTNFWQTMLVDDGWLCGEKPDPCWRNYEPQIHCSSKRLWYNRQVPCDNVFYETVLRIRRNGQLKFRYLWEIGFEEVIEPFFNKTQLGSNYVRVPKTQEVTLIQNQQQSINLYVPYVDVDSFGKQQIEYAYNANVRLQYIAPCPSNTCVCDVEKLRQLSNVFKANNSFTNYLNVTDITGINIENMPLNTTEKYAEQLFPSVTDNPHANDDNLRVMEYSKHSPIWESRLYGFNAETGVVMWDKNGLDKFRAYAEGYRNFPCDGWTGTSVYWEHLGVRMHVSTPLPVGKHLFALSINDGNMVGAESCVIVNVLPPPHSFTQIGKKRCCKTCKTTETQEPWYLVPNRVTKRDLPVVVRRQRYICGDSVIKVCL